MNYKTYNFKVTGSDTEAWLTGVGSLLFDHGLHELNEL